MSQYQDVTALPGKQHFMVNKVPQFLTSSKLNMNECCFQDLVPGVSYSLCYDVLMVFRAKCSKQKQLQIDGAVCKSQPLWCTVTSLCYCQNQAIYTKKRKWLKKENNHTFPKTESSLQVL